MSDLRSWRMNAEVDEFWQCPICEERFECKGQPDSEVFADQETHIRAHDTRKPREP